MKKALLPLLAYVIVCVVAILLPATEGYDSFGWKLLVGQIYAIPVLILSFLISYFINNEPS